jgi:hypothetical protein
MSFFLKYFYLAISEVRRSVHRDNDPENIQAHYENTSQDHNQTSQLHRQPGISKLIQNKINLARQTSLKIFKIIANEISFPATQFDQIMACLNAQNILIKELQINILANGDRRADQGAIVSVILKLFSIFDDVFF